MHVSAIFVENYTNPGNKRTFLKKKASALAAGATEVSASMSACVMSKKPQVKAAIIEALKKVHITPEYQAKRLKKLMEWKIHII